MESIKRFIRENPAIIPIALVMHVGAFCAVVIWPMYFDLRVFCFYAGLWTIVMIPWIVRRFSIGKLAVYALLVASIFFMYTDNHNPRAPFLRDFRRMKPGMTLSQADSIMKAHQRWGSSAEGTVYYTHRHLDERYQRYWGGDAGIVQVRGGKVISVRFAPD